MKENLIYQALRNVSTELYVVSFLAMVNAPYYFQKPDHSPIHEAFVSNDATVTRSSTGLTVNDGSHTEEEDRQGTINEVGLPLFSKRASPVQQIDEIPIVRVNMTREQHVERTYLRR
ncbi:hypothetical protein K435DRAFT_868574 [Dendrothele bispora CBS 962.96]|uniref:Uncharacterized protein n=1 Tax=Dendrothele bispora (strain CBS 962.96) TaxID=1314807 RepID=A0A4S8LCT4_DENBC|nr:hypothetical protein K435DRAFT_868574 [Dendrothele bispora CBS 962.96]